MEVPREANTAVHRVIDTAELLEMILLSLPIKDIVLARRTNKSFRNLTASSPKLLAKLFLRATSAIIRVETLPGRYFMAQKASHNKPIELYDHGTALEFNPLLFTPYYSKAMCGPRASKPISLSLAFAPIHATERFLSGASKRASLSPLATDLCERMFITKPPVSCVGFTWEDHDIGSDSPLKITIRNEAGITFADVLAACRANPRSGNRYRLLVTSPADLIWQPQPGEQFVRGFFLSGKQKTALDGYELPVVWDEVNSNYYGHGFEWNDDAGAWEDEDGCVVVGEWKVGDMKFFESWMDR